MGEKTYWTTEDMQRIAGERGGRCVSPAYHRVDVPLTWECERGHRFDLRPANVIYHGSWCLICSGRRPHSLESMQELARSRGGACLSSTYHNIDSPLRWQCEKGHEWETIPYLVQAGSWCPECAGRKPAVKMLADMHQMALERGGKCLAEVYTKAKDDYEWKCAAGHQWMKTWDQIKGGSWCPICVGRLPPDQALASLQKIAQERGGRCLSDQYVDSKTRLDFECACGYRWSTAPTNIRAGKWCHKCAGILPPTMDELREVARSRGGSCLSKEYVSSTAKLQWRCEKGHTWLAGSSAVKTGTWCPTCAKGPRYSLVDMQALAESRGGICLSKRFTGAKQRFRWQCANGHIWSAAGTQLLNSGTWCPECAGLKRGTIAQARELARERGGQCISKSYVNVKTELRWRCAEGHEWDAIITSLRRGAWCPFCLRKGAKGIGDFLLQDMQRAAHERGGACLSDSYVDAQVPLRWQCQVGHEWEATPQSVTLGSWCPECAHTKKPPLELYQGIARERGGRCLSEHYVNTQTPLEFQCDQGHRWSTRPHIVRKGSWCPECARKRKGLSRTPITLEDLQAIAEENGGMCLSHELGGHLQWRCGLGHEWEAIATSIKQGSWCPTCSGRQPLTMEDMHASAANRGGHCLSETYHGVQVPLLWECAEGHQWQATPFTIRNGSWCPTCLLPTPDAGIARVSELARSLGGLCLSAQHHDPNKRLRWRCSKGHIWWAKEADIVGGHWCPKCSTR